MPTSITNYNYHTKAVGTYSLKHISSIACHVTLLVSLGAHTSTLTHSLAHTTHTLIYDVVLV